MALGTRHHRGFRAGCGCALAIALALVVVVPPIVMELRATPLPRTPMSLPPVHGDFHIFVADWGYHTSVIVEQPAGWRLGPAGAEDAPYVEFTWGDRRFYMESNYQPQSVFATLFLPTSTVTYVAAWRVSPESARPRALYERTVSREQLAMLVASLESSIRHDTAGVREPPFTPVAGYPGRFYPAHGDYLWWFDCNRWTADRLAAAGLASGGRGVILSGQVGARLVGFTRAATP